MIRDRYGNNLGPVTSTAREAYNAGLDLFLGANFGAVQMFERAVAEDPGFALGHAALARTRMVAGDMQGAKAALDAAQRLDGDARTQSHIAALALLLSGQAAAARRVAEAHVAAYPRDVLIAQLCTSVFGLIGFSGCAGREEDLLAYTGALLPAYDGDWWGMSVHAASLCEVGRLEEAFALMERALALNPRNANAAHFKAHILYETGEIATGRAYLADWMQGYDTRAILHGHMRWHEALWALHAGDEDAMWAAVDNGVAPGATSSLPINALTDTAAILHRAQLAGVAVDPDRWRVLSDYAAEFFPAPGQSFADLHAALAHAMAGDGDRLAVLAEATDGFAADLVRPVAGAWAAIAAQDWTGAHAALAPVMQTHARFGGSRAQRDLLELTWANILLRLGRPAPLATRRPALAKAPPLAAMT